MNEKSNDSQLSKRLEPDDLLIVELDTRLEFGAGIIDADLDSMDGNAVGCGSNGVACSNGTAGCGNGNALSCQNNGCC